MTTAFFDIINQIKDSEQAYKQVKYNVETPVLPFIFLINLKLSALFALDLIPAVIIVQDITQPLNNKILQSFTLSAFNLSFAIIVSLITRQPVSGGNSAGTSPAAL